MKSDNARQLLDSIERAFDGVAPPDADHLTLHQAHALDTYKHLPRDLVALGRWQDISLDDIEAYPDAWSYLDEQGLTYYLPALMRHAVSRPEARSPAFARIVSAVHFMLTPAWPPYTDRGPDFRVAQRERLGLLSAAQHHVILAYFKWEHAREADEDLLEAVSAWERVVESEDEADWTASFFDTLEAEVIE